MSEVMRKKHLNYLFLDVSDTSTPDWKRCSTSTDFAIAYNANTEERDYISYENPIDELMNYKPSIAQTQTAYIGDPIYDFVANLARTQAVGKLLPDALVLTLNDYSRQPGASVQPEAKSLPDTLLLALDDNSI